MPTRVRPRFGSLQFWPRKRARKYLPSVNWKPINSEGILGFIILIDPLLKGMLLLVELVGTTL